MVAQLCKCIKPTGLHTLHGRKVWSVVSDSLGPHGLYSPWNSPGRNTRLGSLCLLQGIFPIWGSNPGLWHCRWILYQLSHKGSPRVLEWVAYPFSSGSSRLRNWMRVSCIAGRFFTNWAMREAHIPLIDIFLWLFSTEKYLGSLHFFPLFFIYKFVYTSVSVS